VNRLVSVTNAEDIFPMYRETPIGRLLEYHNLGRPHDEFLKAELLIGMCMDNRKQLHIPDNYAFIIRAGGANLRYSEFKGYLLRNCCGRKNYLTNSNQNFKKKEPTDASETK